MVDAKTLVVFPGWSLGESSYKQLARMLGSWDVIFVPYVDIASEKPIREISDEVSLLLKDNESVFVLGHSLGGILAMDFSARYPDKVAHLFLANSMGSIYDLPFYQIVRGFAQNNLSYVRIAFREQVRASWRVVRSLKTQVRLAKHAGRYDASEVAKIIKVPTTILWGADDRLASIEAGGKLHKLISGSEFHKLKDEGHDWIVHKPEYLLKHLTL